MEAGAIVALVLGSNAIIFLGNWLLVKKQLKHYETQLEKQLEAQREADKHKRQWEVRDEPLVKLRDELAKMAEKLSTTIDLATQVTDEVTPQSDRVIKDLNKAVKEWDEYMKSGEFEKTLHMQYDHNLKKEAHGIFWDYQSAFKGIRETWLGRKEKKLDEEISKAKDVIRENALKVSEIQLKIINIREGL